MARRVKRKKVDEADLHSKIVTLSVTPAIVLRVLRFIAFRMPKFSAKTVKAIGRERFSETWRGLGIPDISLENPGYDAELYLPEIGNKKRGGTESKRIRILCVESGSEIYFTLCLNVTCSLPAFYIPKKTGSRVSSYTSKGSRFRFYFIIIPFLYRRQCYLTQNVILRVRLFFIIETTSSSVPLTSPSCHTATKRTIYAASIAIILRNSTRCGYGNLPALG